jgi:hypothetical protein
MQSKILIVLLFIAINLFSCSKANRKEVSENVYLEKDGNRFNLYSEDDEAGKWKYFDVDSMAIDSGSFLLHGRVSKSDPLKWFAIGTPSKQLQDAANTIHGTFQDKSIYKKLKSTKTLWEE